MEHRIFGYRADLMLVSWRAPSSHIEIAEYYGQISSLYIWVLDLVVAVRALTTILPAIYQTSIEDCMSDRVFGGR